MPLRFLTAGESHGPALTVLVDGLPSGLPVAAAAVDAELRRRQAGYGRGGRMKIEKDAVRILGGVRHGRTTGAPVALQIDNLDFAAWGAAMAAGEPAPGTPEGDLRRVTSPRPGHADLAGALKHGVHDARDILERASARETAARVAAGALARALLGALGTSVASHTVRIGGAAIPAGRRVSWEEVLAIPEASPLRCVDPQVEAAMIREIDAARQDRDSVGGAFEVIAHGVPPGLGSCRQWDVRLDGRLAQAIVSIPAIKGVEIGEAFAASARRGSEAHDVIDWDGEARRFVRPTNRAGGIEGGISNGEEIRLTAYMKPLSTLPRPLRTVDLVSKQETAAAVERTDTCAVPAAGVVAEAMTALVLADAALERFGGDTLEDFRAAAASVAARLREF